MSGWNPDKPDCETCKNSGFMGVELARWREPNLALVECVDCYEPKFYGFAYTPAFEKWLRDREAAGGDRYWGVLV